jgi:hypothetical protein
LIALAAALLCLSPQDVPFPVPTDPRLEVQLVAREPEINTPTGMDVDAKGRIWAVESNTHFPPKNYKGRPADRILVFEDFAPDGRARKVTTFAEGFRYGMSIAVRPEGVYFATRWKVLLLKDTNGDLVCDEQKVLVDLQTKGDYPHNGLCGFAFDKAGNVHFGMGENLGADYALVGSDGAALKGGGEGGNVYRCRPDGSNLEQIATGVWNPFHMCVDPHGRLFLVDNDPDSRPPCRLLHVVQGGDYGFKFRTGRKGLHPYTAWNGELPGTLPMVAGTGEAPSGMVAYDSDAFPPEYRGTLLVTSWGDHILQRFKLTAKGASFTSEGETFVKGGESFRPVGMAVAPDGSIVLTDWVDRSYELHGKGRIWRVRAKSPGTGGTATNLPPDTPELRLMNVVLAARTKEDLWTASSPAPLLASPDPFLVSAAVDALSRLETPEGLARLAGHRDSKVRLGALLALRRKGDRALVGRFLEDADPGVRRAAMQWVGEEGLKEHFAGLEAAAARPPVTREGFEAFLAAVDFLNAGLRRDGDQKGAEFYLIRMLDDERQPPALRALALRMLGGNHPAVTGERLAGFVRNGHPAMQQEALRACGQRPDRDSQMLLRAVMADASMRSEAIPGLAHSAADPETQRQLVAALKDDAPLLRMDALRSLSGAPEAVRKLDLAGEELVLKRKRILGEDKERFPQTVEQWREVGAAAGDAASGERVFFHPKGPQCFVCHRVNGRGGSVGPDLSTIGNSLDRARLIQSILEPSKEVAPMFVLWRFRLKNDDVVDGRILYEDPSPSGFFLVVNAQAQQSKILVKDLEERRPSQLSIMPEKLVDVLTPAEFRDLVSYLAGLK